jgi:SAM-dependent methyltransferase
MHVSSLNNMERFVRKYLEGRASERLRIADIGSQDVNGTYKQFFNQPGWEYIGVDMAEGANVDVVIQDLYRWDVFGDESFDVVISGQAFEHIEFFWLTMQEVARIMKPGGLCCIIAPSNGYEHRYPIDCWRFYPDGMRALARFAGLSTLEAYAQWDDATHPDRDPVWQDCVLVARKDA